MTATRKHDEEASDSATRRLDEFLATASRVSVDDLLTIALPLPSSEVRADRLRAAADAAASAGRGELLNQARERARALIVNAFARRAYEPTWFGLNWGRSLGRPRDRAALIAAVEDAAIAAVVEDLVQAEVVDELASPFRAVAAMEGASPATNPILGSRVGFAGRAALLVLIMLTFAWGLFGDLVGRLVEWLERSRQVIDLL